MKRLLATGLLLLLATAVAAGTLARTRHSESPVWMPAGVPVARYHFDGAALNDRSGLVDSSGKNHTLTPVLGHGATLRRVAHGTGQAVRFPPRCRRSPCPRLVLRAPSTPFLNPGNRAFRYGATVRLAPNRTSKGQNVLQKGFSTEGSQYKLQIDGRSGHPSCVLVAGPAIHLAIARVTVADGRWHTLECRRDRTTLTVLIDNAVQGSTTVPATLTITNDRPLSIGGKSAFGNNDQFHGDLDDVWISLYG
ncbi:LamG-like jellyroll fold domain-containing protein [Actinoplanes sp. NPDC051861]|uniref:LamG-like jellyroll fold domain-containing protein n=1 Tax=Actinoplanes sp. NPDC051861 TaxID=3155170 RepID=UPI0034351632